MFDRSYGCKSVIFGRAAAAIAVNRGRSQQHITAHDHAVFDRHWAEKARMRAIAAADIALNSGQSAHESLEKDHAVFDKFWGNKCVSIRREAEEIE